MKRAICLIIVFVLCLSMCACGSVANREDEESEKDLSEGYYYFVKEMICYDRNGSLSYYLDGSLANEFLKVKFNKEGFPIEYSSNMEDAVIKYKNENVCSVTRSKYYGKTIDEYDAYGELICSSDIYNNHDDWGEDKTYKYENTYNAKGQLINQIKYENDEFVWEISYRYNTNNDIEYSSWREPDEDMSENWYEYEYGDQNGIYCTVYEDGRLCYEEFSEYNESGKIVSYHGMFYDASGKVCDELLYGFEYDERDRIVKVIAYTDDREMYSYYEIEYSDKPMKLTDAQANAFSSMGEEFPVLISDVYSWLRNYT